MLSADISLILNNSVQFDGWRDGTSLVRGERVRVGYALVVLPSSQWRLFVFLIALCISMDGRTDPH